MRKCLIVEKRGPWTQNTERNIQVKRKEIEIPAFMYETNRRRAEVSPQIERRKPVKRRIPRWVKSVKRGLTYIFYATLGVFGCWAWAVLLIILFG